MGDTRRPASHSAPPLSVTADMPWDDDDTAPRLELDEPSFDRVTAIPELPSEVYAKKLMAEAAAAEGPVSGTFSGDLQSPSADSLVGQPTLSPGWHWPIPFELEQALLSSSAALPPDPRRTGSSLASTLPPQTQEHPVHQSTAPAPARGVEGVRGLELDEVALQTALAARGRWARREAAVLLEEAPASLELDLSPPAPPSGPKSHPSMAELKDRYAMGDYSGALIVAEGILEHAPEHSEAQRYAQNCRGVLTQMYAARLGALEQVVAIAIPPDQIRWLSLDHRAGFLLSLVDGTSTVEEILDISGMARLDALRIMLSLLQERVIALSPRLR